MSEEEQQINNYNMDQEEGGDRQEESNMISSDIGAGGDSGSVGKGNEEKKIFVGGISYDTTNEDLLAYFQQFGEVTQAQVKYDQATGRSRGFAFVEFANVPSCRNALGEKDREIKGKRVEVKPAKSRENKKVFVGGLPSEFTEEDLRKHFEQFGAVEDIEWPLDRQRNVRRNFAFVVFEDEQAADQASQASKQKFGDRLCDVKKAVPQPKRFAQFGMGGGRGRGRGRGGGFGGAANWYNQGGWGDWYGAGAAAAYGSGGGYGYYGGGGYGNYGNYGGGYYDADYSANNYDYWSGWGQYANAGAWGANNYDNSGSYGQQAQSPGSGGALRGRYQPY